MMKITELELNTDGKIIALKGTFKRSRVFSVITDRVIYWAEFGLDYVGG
jgi:hypothetical protein